MFERAKRETRSKKKEKKKYSFTDRKAAVETGGRFAWKGSQRQSVGARRSEKHGNVAACAHVNATSIFNSISVSSSRGLRCFPGCREPSGSRVYARERAVACKRALARVCATLIACAAAAQKPNELECLLSCLRSPLCARLPARLSPRVRFETRIKQTALMPDPCSSAPLHAPSSFHRSSHRWRRYARDFLPRSSYRGDEQSRLSDADGASSTLSRFDKTESRTLTCRCARLSAIHREHCERISSRHQTENSFAQRIMKEEGRRVR